MNKSHQSNDPARLTEWAVDALKVYSRATFADTSIPGRGGAEHDFSQRCRDAASTAHAIEMLNAERDRVGFTPTAIGEYVRSLAKEIGIRIELVLAAFGINNLNCPDPKQAYKVAKMARAFGMTGNEAEIAILIAFIRSKNIPTDVLVSRGRSNETCGHLDSCNAALEHLKAENSIEFRMEMSKIEQAIQSAYAADNSSKPLPHM